MKPRTARRKGKPTTMTTDAPKVVIVGAGVAGLAAARRFVRVGFRVVLID